MIQEEYRGARQWSRNAQAVAIVVWVSFLVAAVGTMLFFAMFDPVELAMNSIVPTAATRNETHTTI
ncbi:MAG: hypothetical protein QNJ00_01020, partial [Woeseiaceae bacterium]|nr:hypothetical protein [Woeseiaceae bacterium]